MPGVVHWWALITLQRLGAGQPPPMQQAQHSWKLRTLGQGFIRLNTQPTSGMPPRARTWVVLHLSHRKQTPT